VRTNIRFCRHAFASAPKFADQAAAGTGTDLPVTALKDLLQALRRYGQGTALHGKRAGRRSIVGFRPESEFAHGIRDVPKRSRSTSASQAEAVLLTPMLVEGCWIGGMDS